MNSNQYKIHAFTLIELLTVVAVISILAGILVPVASGVLKQARIAASRAQLSQYVTAIESFRAEYNYYPTIFNGENTYSLEDATNSKNFIESLSGRNVELGGLAQTGGNLNSIQFHDFSSSECFDLNGTIQNHRLADRFNNTSISIKVDGNGDGFITPDPPSGRNPSAPGVALRTGVIAWVVEEADGSGPGYGLWE